MKIDFDKEGFLSKWKYVELARYVPSLSRVIREKDSDGTFLYDIRRSMPYAQKFNNTGIYTSVWHFNTPNIESSLRLGSLYFDIDNENVEVSLEECKALYRYLASYIDEESLIVYYTGKKGFHIECEAVALGIDPSNDLHSKYRYIANDLSKKLSLSSLDFSVYDARRMWRLPGSKHQETGLYKTKLTNDILFSSIEKIMSYSSQEQDNSIPVQQFNYRSNEWYRNYVYDYEEQKNKPVDYLANFNQYGSSSQKTFSNSSKIFDKEKLLSGCSAVKRLDDQAKNKHYLEHEARLFLCSILTYSEEAIEYLHEILSHCEDYNISKSTAHINDWIKRREMGIGGRPYTCDRANSAGVGCGECSLEHRKKWVNVNGRFIETNEKSSPSPIRFAYRSEKKEVNESERG
jgi:hypothetical protein